MATKLESGFAAAVAVAAGIRQASYQSALATYGGVPANYAAYIASLVSADNTYYSAVQTAASTAGVSAGVAASLWPGQLYNQVATILT